MTIARRIMLCLCAGIAAWLGSRLAPNTPPVAPPARFATIRTTAQGCVIRQEDGATRVGFRTPHDEIGMSFRPARISRGDCVLSQGDVAEWRAGDEGVDAVHGNGITERYVRCGPTAEQLFLFAERPPGRGPLVIANAVTFSAPTIPSRADDGLRWSFRGSPTADLIYYGAKVIDAQGRETALRPRLEGAEIRLEIADDVVEAFDFPLVVDPWIELASSASGGGISSAGATSNTSALAVDACGTPFVAYSVFNPPAAGRIRLKKWDAVSHAWVGLGGSDTGDGISGSLGWAGTPAIAIDLDGNPVVAWSEDRPPNGIVYLRRWNPTTFTWEELGGSGSGLGFCPPGESAFPSVGIDSSNNPVVAWRYRFSNQMHIYVRRWNPQSGVWDELAGSATGEGISTETREDQSPKLAIDSQDRISVSWEGSLLTDIFWHVYLKRWDPTLGVWESLGGSGGGEGISVSHAYPPFPTLALDSSGNPGVAWQDAFAGINRIYFRRWNGASWEQLAGSGSGNGVSGETTEGSLAPSLKFDRSDRPVVTWCTQNQTYPEILLRRWNPTAVQWEGIEGSETPAGISSNAGASVFPSLAIDVHGDILVSWGDSTSGHFEVYLRAYPGVGPALSVIAGPAAPISVGSPVTLGASFTDRCGFHTATFDWGDGTTSSGSIVEDEGAGTVTGTHTYASAGVYTVVLVLQNDWGQAATATFGPLAVFDPAGGYVTGGGWIDSPPGAVSGDPEAAGRADFGFVAHYLSGATVPSGETEFRLVTASLNFHSADYEWLIVAGGRAQWRGTGTVNGAGGYAFFVTTIDGGPGGSGDRVRLKIWNALTSEVLYDNQPGQPDESDAGTDLSGGNITVHGN